MPIVNHTHTFIRYRKKKTSMGEVIQTYRCYDPRCTYRVDRDFIKGKANKCPCGKEFILSGEDLRRAFPKCLNCSDTAASRQYKTVKQLSDSLFPSREDDSENIPENIAYLELIKAEDMQEDLEPDPDPESFL